MYEIIFASFGLAFSNCLGLNLFYTIHMDLVKDSNFLIFIILFYNSINWIIYSVWFNNLYLLLASIFVPFGSFSCMIISFHHLSHLQKNIFAITSSILYIFFIIYIALLRFSNLEHYVKNYIVDYSLIFNVIASIMPLTSIVSIIKNRSTKTLYIPFTIINAISSILWLNYSLIINNYFLIFVFSFGIFTSLIESILHIYCNVESCYQSTIISDVV
jgi:hypothetical protein